MYGEFKKDDSGAADLLERHDRAKVTGGNFAKVTGGDASTVTGGDDSTVTGGNFAKVTGGDDSSLSIWWWDGKRMRLVTAYVGEDEIKPDTWYKVENGKFVEVK